MANQYVANTLVGIDVPADDVDSGFKTAWYEKGEVIEAPHASAMKEETLRTMINDGSVLVQNIRNQPAEAPAPNDPPKDSK
jgi:hypothetical protein